MSKTSNNEKTADPASSYNSRSLSSPPEAQAVESSGDGSLERTHTFWSLMAYQTTILTSWSCNITLYYYIFTLGGPASLLYGTIVVTIGNTLLMASLAEYASLWPNAGGQQYYTQVVAPESIRRLLSYIVGWCILVGEVSVAAGCALNSAQIVATFVELTHENFDWKPYMTFLLYGAFLLLPFITGVLAGSKYQPAIQLFGCAFNITAGIVWAIVFLVMADKTSSEFVFTKFINTSGWTNDGWVFILSLYVPIYGLYGTDSVMHLAEEMKNPSRDGPRVMIWSMIWAGVTCFLSAIVMCYTVGPDWESRLDELSSYIAWFMDVTRSTYGGGIFCAIVNMGLNFMIILNQSTASARMIWKMAKKNAFPGSSWLSKINSTYRIPINALIAFFIFNFLIGLLVLGSDLAFYAILSGGGVALQVSYCIPVLCVVLRDRDQILPPGRPEFDLGKFWGPIINWVSLAWSVLVVLFYVFPQYMPVVGDLSDMNWAIAILGGVCILALLSWFITARKHYMVGPSQDEQVAKPHGKAEEI